MKQGWDASASPKIGDAVPRKEDQRLLLGAGQFGDDRNAPGQVYAAMVRSPHPHARILGVDASAALALPGVLCVLTGADAMADGLRPIPHSVASTGVLDVHVRNESGDPFLSDHRVLPLDKARYIGEAVAMVVAETRSAARDGAECVAVAYEPLDFTIQATQARDADAALVHDGAPQNTALDGALGDHAAVEAAFAQAAHAVKLDTWIQRVTGVPMEPRSALAVPDVASGRITLMAGGGNVVRQKRELAAVLGAPEDDVRVIAGDVGGNFGTRNAFYVEFALVAWAARRLGRPVKWTADRSESFLSDYQGRDLEAQAELALDEDGRFLALRSVNTSNIGAYSVSFGPLTKGVELATSVYAIPCARVRGRAVYTNTPPTNSYRSSGRPEAMFIMERLIDMAARQHGFDRVEIRRRNLIARDALPYTNALGLTYDSGAYERTMDAALARGAWSTFEARRAEARARGKLRGIAVANYIEIASGIPRERCEVSVDPAGRVDVVIGTLSSGQGHATSFAQLVTDAFGVRLDEVNLITGDTDRVKAGGGSHAGRSMRLAGVVIGKASAEIIDKARRIAAHAMEGRAEQIMLRDGRFSLEGSNRSLGIFDLATLSETSDALPPDLRGGLSSVCDEVSKSAGFPFGSHVCEIEIDPDTGVPEIVGYVAVDDVGRAINPLILHGQAHGAITQGLGQALFEKCHYDSGSGQLIAGSFMDYAMPKAAALPRYDTIISEQPATTNPLGVRAGGEGGTTPALAVIVNAIVDALRDHGVTHMEMPVTAASIWEAIHAADAANALASTGFSAPRRPRT
ncbi:MAG: carbon monoxide dehydrogenase [Hyphomicrobiales bacterium]|nr:carbon monoxide dehydrogenase [Hyphomicrobiales bacterium]